MQSTGLQFAISAIGVLVFAGLTAYDTQRIKAMYYDGYGQEGKKAIMAPPISVTYELFKVVYSK